MNKANASDYAFEAYDILQILMMGGWTDYTSLRTESEGREAIRKIHDDFSDTKWRIVSSDRQTVKYSLGPAPADWDSIEA